jgi:hypothetical protein
MTFTDSGSGSGGGKDERNPTNTAPATTRSSRYKQPPPGKQDQDIETKVEAECEGDVIKKHVLLPARSLAILSGPARYSWTHGIAPRKFDKVSTGQEIIILAGLLLVLIR